MSSPETKIVAAPRLNGETPKYRRERLVARSLRDADSAGEFLDAELGVLLRGFWEPLFYSVTR
jgi:hypothetical protein